MKRRSFNKKIALAAATAPLAVATVTPTAFGSDLDRSFGLPPHDRVVIKTKGKTSLISKFLLLSDNGIHAVDLRGAVPQMAADRIDLGDVPILGEILTPTLKRHFAGAVTVGTLYRVGRDIVLLPARTAPAPQAKKVWITHRDVVYQPAAKLRPMRRKPLLTAEQAMSAPVIGKAVMQGDLILAIIPPSVLDNFEFGNPASDRSDS